MKEEWLFHGAVVPIDVETTAALVAEIKRLIDVIGGMALAQPEQEPVAYDKTEMNCFVQDLYDKKMLEGKHGHYETMFHVVHQAIKIKDSGWVRCTHPVKDLEDIDINITWNENSMRDFGKDELNFARAILRKAQEK